jgi:hypothetical protein
MDAARQVVRWSIPGWVFLFSAASIQLVTSLYWAGSPQALLGSGSLNMISPAMIALVVASGIPLGFLIYQIYYFVYGNVFPLGIVNRDRGAEVLQGLPQPLQGELGQLAKCKLDFSEMCEHAIVPVLRYPIVRLKAEHRTRQGRKVYRERLQGNWEAVRFLLHVLCLRNESSEIRNEVTTLADIYHSIGASRIAIVLSIAMHFSYNLARKGPLISQVPLKVILSIVLPYVLVYALLVILESTRRHTLNSLQAFLAHTLSFFCGPYQNTALWPVSGQDNKESA